jgi:hypothetical protein
MITILSALICINAVCYQVTVPAPVTLELQSCIDNGDALTRKFINPPSNISNAEPGGWYEVPSM